MERIHISGVTNNVAEHLRIKIIAGELKPGQRLFETHLSEQLGVSRPPLREAFRILENAQLVKNISRKGTFVTEISMKYFEEIHAARCMIECFAIELLREQNNKSPKDVKETLTAASRNPEPSPDDTENLLEFWRILSSFHLRLVESCGNSVLTRFYSVISDNLARTQFLYLKIPGSVKDSIQEHQQVLKLIENGKHDQAREALKEHLDRTFSSAYLALKSAQDGRILLSRKVNPSS
jgi:DNA-binding GntR family transcriptional regulator